MFSPGFPSRDVQNRLFQEQNVDGSNARQHFSVDSFIVSNFLCFSSFLGLYQHALSLVSESNSFKIWDSTASGARVYHESKTSKDQSMIGISQNCVSSALEVLALLAKTDL
jgi:hypothetical protein